MSGATSTVRGLTLALVVAVATPALAVVTLQKSSMGSAYTGGTLGFQITTTRVGAETALVIHDVTPAGLTLLGASAGAATLDCTTHSSGALGPDYPLVSCNVGGELQAHVSDFASNPAPLLLSYRAPATAASVVNTATATCNGGCSPTPSASASASVAVPSLMVQKTAPASARPSDILRWTITVTNPGPWSLDSFTVDDAIPAGTTLLDVAIGGATFSAADLASTKRAPDGASASFAGTTLTVQGPKLASLAAYRFAIDARLDSSPNEGATIANVARATPLGGAPVASPAATTAVQSQAPPLMLQKRVTPMRARIGDSVTYTLTVTPNGTQPGPWTLVDPLDPALKPGAVKLDGNVVTCGSAPLPAGRFTLSCGSDGRTVTVALPAGGTLTAPLTVEIAATVLPSAPPQVQNVATLTDATGAAQSATQPLTVADASTSGASLTIAAAKLAAAKADLVPFVVHVGVPLGAATLGSPIVTLTPSRGLRVSDVRVTAADGTTLPVRPVEASASLLVPIGTMAPGATASLLVRTRLNGRAAVGGRETLRATLTQDATALAAASAVVRVEAEAEFDLGTLLGEVFRDDNGNGQRDRGEPGLAGALVVMDDGLQAVTDAAGRYHLAAVVPGDRAIKIAEYTLPPGSTLTTDVTRIVPVTPGSLVKVDFGVRVPRARAAARPPAGFDGAARAAPGRRRRPHLSARRHGRRRRPRHRRRPRRARRQDRRLVGRRHLAPRARTASRR